MWHSTKRCSLIFDLCPLTPKICTKSPISWLVWHIDRRCLVLSWGFRGWPIQWNHAKCCGANPYCHGNEIWARHGDPVAYRLVSCMCLCMCPVLCTCGSDAPLKLIGYSSCCIRIVQCTCCSLYADCVEHTVICGVPCTNHHH